MVDITLVLLIIFMVTASFVSDAGLNIKLPKASTTEASATASLTVTLNADGETYLMKDRVDEAGLQASLKREIALNPGLRVTLAADRDLDYGRVIALLDLIKQTGVRRIALAAER